MCLENMHSLLKSLNVPEHDFKKLLGFSTEESHLLYDIYVQHNDQIVVVMSSPHIHLMVNNIPSCARLKKNGSDLSGLQF